MAIESKMHQELFNWLREKNLPEREIPRNEKEWFREIDFDLYKKIAQREWSGNYGFFRPSLIQSVDYVCIIGKRAWILEGKKDPNHEAIGQVLIYKDLFKEDYPMFEEVKTGIVCKEQSPLNEPTCRKLGISIFGGGDDV